MLLQLLAGCQPEDPGVGLVPEEVYDLLGHALPAAPDDPVIVELVGPSTVTFPAEPDILDAQGARVPIEPLYLGTRLEGYAAQGGFPPGRYEIVGALGVLADKPVPFDVLPYGLPPLDLPSLAGRAWLVSSGQPLPWALSSLAIGQLGRQRLVLSIEEATAGDVVFRVVAREGRSDCLVLRDRAALDPLGGSLVWQRALLELVVPTEGGALPVSLRDLDARVAFLQGDTTLAWASASGVADLSSFDASDLPLCDTAAALGAPCEPCEGSERCMPAALASLRLVELVEDLPPSPLPSCGIDYLSPLPVPEPISCASPSGAPCGCRGLRGSSPLALLLAAAAARRARR